MEAVCALLAYRAHVESRIARYQILGRVTHSADRAFEFAICLSSAIRRILRHLDLPADPIELAPARAPPELDDAWAC